MDISKMIKRLILECDSTAADLSARLGSTPQNISQRIKRNTWSVADLEQIAGAYGCGLIVGFVLPDGQTITQQAAPENFPASQKIGAAEAPKIPAEDSGD